MSTITKERAQQIFLGNGPEPTASEERELARIALASLEAEPVGEVVLGEYDDCGCHPDARVVCIAADGQADWENFKDGARLYTAPPAPVSVPDEVTTEDCPAFVKYDVTDVDEAWSRGFNACRAAMLQGGDGNSPVIPDWQTQAEKMAELYGSSFVLFRNGESPQCADPTKVIISFTDDGLGHGSAAPQQEAK